MGEAVCVNTSSGCRGGWDSNTYCAPTLEGPLCRLCTNATGENVYYVAASGEKVAACTPCGAYAASTIGIGIAVVAAAVIVIEAVCSLARKCQSHVETVKRYWTAANPETKLKICVGFCEPGTYQSRHTATLATCSTRELSSCGQIWLSRRSRTFMK